MEGMDYEVLMAEDFCQWESDVRFHDITHDDMKNGPGLRVVLWVAGCDHHCRECQNPLTWDPDGGAPFTQWEQAEFYEWLLKPWTQGVTFSGGDPLHPVNREPIGKMAKAIKQRNPDKDIWVYTGYVLQASEKGCRLWDQEGNAFEYPYLEYFDVLIDGRFDADLRREDIKNERIPKWRGSSNQRIIDVKKTLESGAVVEWEDLTWKSIM